MSEVASLKIQSQLMREGIKSKVRYAILTLTCCFVACQVVDMVTSSGTSVAFHILDEESYKQAKAKGVDLAGPPITGAEKTEAQSSPKAKLCYLVRSTSGFGFSLSSFISESHVPMTIHMLRL